MDFLVAGGERVDCAVGWAEVAGSCEHYEHSGSAKCGEFLA
jgi:hypothetical protein